jgi:hypothetical protein
MKRKSEYGNFERTVNKILKVSHAELIGKLEAEKDAKRRKKSKTSSASRVADDRG